jgi:hypothetical protein
MAHYPQISSRARGFRFVLALTIVSAAFAAAPSASGAASAKSFRRAADKLCTQLLRNGAEYDLEHGPAASLEEDIARTEASLEDNREMLAAFEELNPPKKLRAGYEDYLELRREKITLDEEFLEIAATGDEAALQEGGSDYQANFERRREAARAIGLTACANDLSKREAKKVRAIVQETFLEGDPAFCTEKYTEVFVEKVLGGLEQCEAEEGNTANAASDVEFRDIFGVDKVAATARITVSGGSAGDGQDLLVETYYQDGIYKRYMIYEDSPTT